MNIITKILKLIFFGYALYKNPTTLSSRMFFETIDEVFCQDRNDTEDTIENVYDESRDIITEIDDQKCILCETNKKNIVFVPCSHSVSCIGCTKKLIQYSNRCPLCRVTIENKIFYF